MRRWFVVRSSGELDLPQRGGMEFEYDYRGDVVVIPDSSLLRSDVGLAAYAAFYSRRATDCPSFNVFSFAIIRFVIFFISASAYER